MKRNSDDWDWDSYFLMQHHECPTRLLDWSDGALMAMHFALRDKKNDGDDARVYVLEPYRLNDKLNELPDAKIAAEEWKQYAMDNPTYEIDEEDWENRWSAGRVSVGPAIGTIGEATAAVGRYSRQRSGSLRSGQRHLDLAHDCLGDRNRVRHSVSSRPCSQIASQMGIFSTAAPPRTGPRRRCGSRPMAPPHLSRPLKKARSRHWALLFTDEASFRQDWTLHATWSRIGRPSEIPATGECKNAKILGAIELWRTRFDYRQETVFNATTYLGFLQQLARRYRRQGAILIQADASYHKDTDVWAWFKFNRHWLEVHQLPPCSPELNPTERLWRHTRKNGTTIDSSAALTHCLPL